MKIAELTAALAATALLVLVYYWFNILLGITHEHSRLMTIGLATAYVARDLRDVFQGK